MRDLWVQKQRVGVASLRLYSWEFGSVMAYDFFGSFCKWTILIKGASTEYHCAHVFWFHAWRQRLKFRVGTKATRCAVDCVTLLVINRPHWVRGWTEVEWVLVSEILKQELLALE